MSNHIEYIKGRLDEVSPTHCLVKWKHASVYLAAGTVKSCCHNFYSNKKSTINDSNLAFHDTEKDQKIREELLQGQKPKECDFCWNNEKTGSYSDRLFWSSLSFMRDFVDEVAEHQSPKALSPSWLEINFSPKCQLRCAYCGPEVSSAWKKEVDEFGPYKTDPYNGAIDYLIRENRNPYEESGRDEFREAFWSWFAEIYLGIRQITITGGEPLLSEDFDKLLEWIDANPHPELQLSINTNLSLPAPVWDKYVQKFKRLRSEGKFRNLFVHPSLDTWGEQAEYIRYGLKLPLLKKNVESYLKENIGDLVFSCTLNCMSLPKLIDFWQYVYQLKKEFPHQYISSTSEPLLFPDFMRVSVLPPSFIKYVDEILEFLESQGEVFSDHEKNGLRRVRTLMEQGENPEFHVKQKKNFYTYFKEYDRRKKTNFLLTFPEMHEFWKECQALCEPSKSPLYLNPPT